MTRGGDDCIDWLPHDAAEKVIGQGGSPGARPSRPPWVRSTMVALGSLIPTDFMHAPPIEVRPIDSSQARHQGHPLEALPCNALQPRIAPLIRG
jgi:hypothetical protein